MKMYMAYDKHAGKEEGTCLVFANSSKEAKKISAGIISGWYGCDYVDVQVNLIEDSEYLQQYSVSDKPHVIESPEVCSSCELWGTGELVKGVCEQCVENEL